MDEGKNKANKVGLLGFIMAIIAEILSIYAIKTDGITAVVLFFICGLFLLAALILSIIGLKNKPRVFPIIGLCISGFDILISLIIGFILIVTVVSEDEEDTDITLISPKSDIAGRIAKDFFEYDNNEIVETGIENGYGYVDLGLSVMWATYNMGSDKPEGIGELYAWGEVKNKEKFNEKNYRFRGKKKYKKYYKTDSIGKYIPGDILESCDDAASITWGGKWRIPTKEEFRELKEQCFWYWGSFNGVAGYKITSSIEGFRDRFIFLPADVIYTYEKGLLDSLKSDQVLYKGIYWANELYNDNYWINELVNTDKEAYAPSFFYDPDDNDYFGMDDIYWSSHRDREEGHLIRPVFTSSTWKGLTSISLDKDYLDYYQLPPDCKTTIEVKVMSGARNYSFSIKDTDILWTSSDDKVATVSGRSGHDYMCNVHTHSSGKAVITGQIKNGEKVTFTIEVKDYAQTTEFVDLGLSVMWATCNVGAANPWDIGEYYAWGEIQKKSEYSWDTYKYIDGEKSLIKYNLDSITGPIDNKISLDSEDDVARVKWGGKWRMPTESEFIELMKNCVLYRDTIMGVGGVMVVSKVPGYTDNAIFLPNGDNINKSSVTVGLYSEVSYWSKSGINNSSRNSRKAACFYIDRVGKIRVSDTERYEGLLVRPVFSEDEQIIEQEEKTTKIIPLEASNISFKAYKKPFKKETDKSKKVKMFEVKFTITENEYVKTGIKNIYLRVIKPHNSLLDDFKFKISRQEPQNVDLLTTIDSYNPYSLFYYQGDTLRCTDNVLVEYNGVQQEVTINIPVESKYMDVGTYNAYLYSDGIMIGEQSITLK